MEPFMYVLIAGGIIVLAGLTVLLERLTSPDEASARRTVAHLEALRREADQRAEDVACADVDAWLDYPQADR